MNPRVKAANCCAAHSTSTPPQTSNPTLHNLPQAWKHQKESLYDQRIRDVEKATFTPLILAVKHWGSWACHHHIQETWISPINKMGSALQHHHGLDQVQAVQSHHTLNLTVYSRIVKIVWPINEGDCYQWSVPYPFPWQSVVEITTTV